MARREAPEINAGSMADIAFLLLIFFLVTTTMDVDKGISRKLPPIIEDEQEKPPPIKEKNVFVVLLNSQDGLFVEDDYMDIEDLRELLSSWRETRKAVWTTVVRIATGSLLLFIAGAVWLSLKGNITGEYCLVFLVKSLDQNESFSLALNSLIRSTLLRKKPLKQRPRARLLCSKLMRLLNWRNASSHSHLLLFICHASPWFLALLWQIKLRMQQR